MQISDETYKFITYVVIGSLIIFLILLFIVNKYFNIESIKPIVR